jgi:hypothetical protein
MIQKISLFLRTIISFCNSKIPPWKYILLLFIITRITLTIIGVSSVKVLEPYQKSVTTWHFSSSQVLNVWGVWDTGWYLTIAEHGYTSRPHTQGMTAGQADIAFFPLYPLGIFLIQLITQNYFVSGLIISNICLLGSAVLLYKLMRLDYEEETARRGITYLFLFPTAFILSGVFSESLYLFLVLMCFFYFRRQKWLLVALASFLLALSRPLGVFIIIPLLYEYLSQIHFSFSKIKLSAAVIVAPPLVGLALFMFFNFKLTGDPLAFVHAQSGWGRSLVNPLGILGHNLLSHDINTLFTVYFVLSCSALLIYVAKKIRTSYLIFAVYSIVVPLCSGLMSLPRYLVAVFPLSIALAICTKKNSFDQLLVIMLCLIQGFFLVFWSYGFTLVV